VGKHDLCQMYFELTWYFAAESAK